MEIIERNIAEVIPYEKNPRVNDQAVDAIMKSIQQFGFNSPIIVDNSGVIICGHTRYKAALRLGLTSVPVAIASDSA